jgi:hypothetical protein
MCFALSLVNGERSQSAQRFTNNPADQVTHTGRHALSAPLRNGQDGLMERVVALKRLSFVVGFKPALKFRDGLLSVRTSLLREPFVIPVAGIAAVGIPPIALPSRLAPAGRVDLQELWPPNQHSEPNLVVLFKSRMPMPPARLGSARRLLIDGLRLHALDPVQAVAVFAELGVEILSTRRS